MRDSLTFVAVVLSFVACGGVAGPLSEATDRGGGPDAGTAPVDRPPPPLDPTLFACEVDADCLAIPAGGCCPDGNKVAVNIRRVGDYENAMKCTATTPMTCPPPRENDKRVAECKGDGPRESRKCEMVAIADILCGGFTGDPHQCPKGLECEEPANDGPGRCVEPKRDCRSTGCNMYNEYCAECAGVYACRSVHSSC